MKRYKREVDKLGNYYTIMITDIGSVLMSNQHGVACSLASAYNGGHHGHDYACEQVRVAAHKGITALNRVSGYKWTELPPARSDLTEEQKETIRSAMNDLFNDLADRLALSVDQAPSAKALMEMLIRKQPASNLVE